MATRSDGTVDGKMTAAPTNRNALEAHRLRVSQQVYRVLTNLVAALASSVGGPMEAMNIIEKEMGLLRGDLQKAADKAAKRTRKGK
jgi:hypothetical protein